LIQKGRRGHRISFVDDVIEGSSLEEVIAIEALVRDVPHAVHDAVHFQVGGADISAQSSLEDSTRAATCPGPHALADIDVRVSSVEPRSMCVDGCADGFVSERADERV